jgi:hypothetical protein
VCNVTVFKQSHYLRYGIYLAYVLQKLVAQPCAFGRTFYQPGNVYKLDNSGHDVFTL